MFALKLENESGAIVDIDDGVNYQVIAASGLNPPSASLFTSKSPNRKGAKHNGSTLDERNIVITIKLLGDIEESRNALYDWVDTEQYCKIRYQNGVKNVYCEGYVQDCDIDLFTDNELVSLAVVCGDPYWKDLQEISREISTLLREFTFPFAIDSAGIPISTIRANNTTRIFNAGAETGVIIYVKANGDIKNLAIYDAKNASKSFKINTTIQAGLVLEIDTANNPKTVRARMPDGSTENYLKYVADNPTWFKLKKGYNSFAYTADNGTTNIEITLNYTNKYLGV